jgi:hypothetical protein
MEWKRFRTESLARAKQIGFAIDIPVKRPLKSGMPETPPTPVTDSRTDLNTTDLMRKGKNY